MMTALIGVVSSIRAAMKLRAPSIANIYDVQWWVYAVSGSRKRDVFLGARPEYGRAILERMNVSEEENAEYANFLDMEGGRDATAFERLELLARCARDGMSFRTFDETASLTTLLNRWRASKHTWTVMHDQRKSTFRNFALGIISSYGNVDARAFADFTQDAIVVDSEDVGRFNWSRVRVNVDGVNQVLLDVDTAERYTDLHLVCNADKYSLYKNEQGNGVVIFNAEVFKVQQLVYGQPSLSNVPQLGILRIDNARAKLDVIGDDDVLVKVCIVTVTRFSKTLLAAIEDARDDNAAVQLIIDAVEAIANTEDDFTRNNITSENILLGEYGLPLMFMDFSALLPRDKGREQPEFEVHLRANGRGVQITRYDPTWDVFAFLVQLVYEGVRVSVVNDAFRRLEVEYDYIVEDYVFVTDDELTARMQYKHKDEFAIVTVTRSTVSLEWRTPKKNELRLNYRDSSVLVDITEFVAQGYRLAEKLGKGAYGIVYALQGREDLAAKITLASDRELDVQQMASNLGFAPEVFYSAKMPVITVNDKTPKKTYADGLMVIVMARMQTTVLKLLRNEVPVSFDLLRRVVNTMFSLVRDFSDAGFMHHDLKTDNIMVNIQEGGTSTVTVKIIDYGKAWYAGMQGATPYMWHENSITRDMERLKWNFNVVRWMGTSIRQSSRVYDTMSLFLRMCENVRELPMFTDELEERRRALWNLMTVDKINVLSVHPEDDTRVLYIAVNNEDMELVVAYAEYSAFRGNIMWMLISGEGDRAEQQAMTGSSRADFENRLRRYHADAHWRVSTTSL